MKEVQRIIRGLSLRGVQSSEIEIRRLPWDENQIHRGITIYPTEEREAAGTNQREDIGYGVGVALILPNDSSLREHVGRVSEWRSIIRRQFIHGRLSNVVLTGGHYCITKVEHHQLNIPREAHRYEASSLIIRCWMRESRSS